MEFSEVYNLKDRYDFPLLEVFKRSGNRKSHAGHPARACRIRIGKRHRGLLDRKSVRPAFDLYIRETFLRPLGMEKADFPFTDANKAMLATGL